MARFRDPNRGGSFFPGADLGQFYGNRMVRRERYSQPILMGKVGRDQGVYGFGADLYCPYCDETFDFILVEFENSQVDSSLAWGEITLEEFGVDLRECPKCGKRELVLELI